MKEVGPAVVYLQIEVTDSFVDSNGVTQTPTDEPFTCGGTLIDSYTVLTAAHCQGSQSFSVTSWSKTYKATVANYLNPKFYSVYLGVFNNSFPSGPPWGHAIQASVKAVIPVIVA